MSASRGLQIPFVDYSCPLPAGFKILTYPSIAAVDTLKKYICRLMSLETWWYLKFLSIVLGWEKFCLGTAHVRDWDASLPARDSWPLPKRFKTAAIPLISAAGTLKKNHEPVNLFMASLV